MKSRSLESYEERRDEDGGTFETLVPGLSAARRRRERRLREFQVDPEDQASVKEMLELSEDEEILYEEE